MLCEKTFSLIVDGINTTHRHYHNADIFPILIKSGTGVSVKSDHVVVFLKLGICDD